MAIHYPPFVWYSQVDATSRQTLLDTLKVNLQAAGWTIVGDVASYVEFTFSGAPVVNNWFSIDGWQYWWRTTPSNTVVREVKVVLTAEEAASNMVAVINRDPAGAGTIYSTATVQHPTCVATLVTPTKVRVSYRTPGNAGIGIVANQAQANVTLDSGAFRGAGFKANTAVTPQGLQARLYIYDQNNTGYVYFRPSDVEESVYPINNWEGAVAIGQGVRLEFRGHPYGVWMWALNSYNDNRQLFFEVPWIREENVAPYVTEITGNTITTSWPHRAQTGNRVHVARGTANGGHDKSRMNGTWQVEVAGDSTLSLIGLGGSVPYDAGSARVAVHEANQISAAWWMVSFAYPAGAFQTFRRQFFADRGCNFLNGQSSFGGATAIMTNVLSPGNLRLDNWGGYADLMEARIGWPVSSPQAERHIVGELWGAFVITRAAPMDTLKADFDGHDWINLCGDYANGSLWLNKT